jgi:hypothetical protein
MLIIEYTHRSETCSFLSVQTFEPQSNLPNDQVLADTVALTRAPRLSATQDCQAPTAPQLPIVFRDPAPPSDLSRNIRVHGDGQFRGM